MTPSEEVHNEATKVFNKLNKELSTSVFVRLSDMFTDYFEGIYSHDDDDNVVFFQKREP